MTEASTSALRCEPFGPEHVSALGALFERCESGCYCEWWHFEGDKNEWLARLAQAPEQNATRLAERARTPGPHGVVALAAYGIVGWMKLTPALAVPKLYAQRPYRGLPLLGARSEILTIGCFLVEPSWRRRGVADALLDAGIELSRRAGARAIEAFPRRGDALRPEERWTGPFELFIAHDFRIVHELTQYPVLRRML